MNSILSALGRLAEWRYQDASKQRNQSLMTISFLSAGTLYFYNQSEYSLPLLFLGLVFLFDTGYSELLQAKSESDLGGIARHVGKRALVNNWMGSGLFVLLFLGIAVYWMSLGDRALALAMLLVSYSFLLEVGVGQLLRARANARQDAAPD